ncbi:MAG: hypothetical protein KIS74_04755 [Burkholderiales bacterium]|nr:hypothetical protein [Burkholderiales bacterium]
MVATQIRARGVRDPRVLAAMERVPRHEFVPPVARTAAYGDHPLPIGHGQTISQPFIVAFMTEALKPAPTDRVLEVGTGCANHGAAGQLVVYDRIDRWATRLSGSAGGIHVRVGDGYRRRAPTRDHLFAGACPGRWSLRDGDTW